MSSEMSMEGNFLNFLNLKYAYGKKIFNPIPPPPCAFL